MGIGARSTYLCLALAGGGQAEAVATTIEVHGLGCSRMIVDQVTDAHCRMLHEKPTDQIVAVHDAGARPRG